MKISEDVIALIDRSEASNVRASVLSTGGEVLDIGGGVAAFAGDGSPFTQVAGVGVGNEVSREDFQSIIDFYKGRCRQFEFKLSLLSPPSLREYVVRAAKSLPEFETFLVCDLSTITDSKPNVDIRTVDKSDCEAYAQRAVDRFHGEGNAPPGFVEALARAAFRAGVHSHEIWMDGKPVAGCGLIVTGEVAWLAGAATMPAYRGQGLHKAMQLHRMQVAKELGCTIAVQAAFPGSVSQQNAQKSGFLIAFTRPTFYL